MELREFERRAREVWDEIPDIYRSGVDGLVLERRASPHPEIPDIYTLGECLTESYPSDWGGPETTRSVLVLYYGSFRKLAKLDPEFDWEYELWETVTHELRHHLESLAAEDALEDVDYAMDENFKRLHGDPFDPYFFRSGEPLAAGVYTAERDVFLEVPWGPDRPPGPEVVFEWEGARYAVAVPESPGEVTFLQVVEGVEADVTLCVVLVRRRGWLEQLRSLFRRGAPDVVDVDVEARPAGDPGGSTA
jgi:hypothetical protein